MNKYIDMFGVQSFIMGEGKSTKGMSEGKKETYGRNWNKKKSVGPYEIFKKN